MGRLHVAGIVRITKDPVEATMPGDGTKVISFHGALDRTIKKPDGKYYEPLWVEFSAFERDGKLPGWTPYVKKGDALSVRGVLDFRTYTVEGESRTSFVIKYPDVELLPKGEATTKKEDDPFADEDEKDGW